MKKEDAIKVISDIITEAALIDGSLCYISADEIIALEMAIEALKRDDPEVEFQKRFEKSTFCGYTAKELLMFADACKQQDVSNDMLYDFCSNVESAYVYIVEKMQQEMKRKLS